MNGARTSGELRAHNRVRLLRAVHDCGATRTRSQLTRDLGLARGTASVLVAGLADDELLHEEPAPEHGRGRPTQVPGPHPRGPLALAVDVREDAWELAACELGGRATVLATRPHDGTPEGALGPLGEAIAAEWRRLGHRVIGVGVALAGPVRHGGLVDIAHLGWRSVDVPALLGLHPAQVHLHGLDGAPTPEAGTAGRRGVTGEASAEDERHLPSERPTGEHGTSDEHPTGEHGTSEERPTARHGGTSGGRELPGKGHSGEHAPTGERGRGLTGGGGLTGEEGGAGGGGGVGAPGSPEQGRSGDAGVTLVVGNDTAFAALAEARRGRLQGVRVGLHLHVDFDLGGVLVVDGHPLGGATGTGAEFGHMPLTGGDRPCPCGAIGCWSMDVGANALLRHVGLAYGGGRGREQAEHVLATSREAVAENARALGRGIAALVNAHDPEAVTLSGHGVELYERAGDALMAACEPGLMAIRRDHPPRIEGSALGWRGSLLGAMESVFDAFLTPEGLDRWRANHPDQGRDTPDQQSVTNSTLRG